MILLLCMLASCFALQGAALDLDADARFAQRFDALEDVRYEHNELTFLQSNFSWAKIACSVVGAIGFGFLAGMCFVQADNESRYNGSNAFAGLATGLGVGSVLCATGCVGYGIHHACTHEKVPVLTFNRNGLLDDQDDTIFTWKEYQTVSVTDEYDKKWHAHTIKPKPDADGNAQEHQTGYWEKIYCGRQAIFQGRYGERLWAVHEYESWLPVRFNDLLDTVQHYKDHYGH